MHAMHIPCTTGRWGPRRSPCGAATCVGSAPLTLLGPPQNPCSKTTEAGEYAEAILQCVEAYQTLEALPGLAVAEPLKALAQQQYFESLRRLDTALANVAADFRPETYSKVGVALHQACT